VWATIEVEFFAVATLLVVFSVSAISKAGSRANRMALAASLGQLGIRSAWVREFVTRCLIAVEFGVVVALVWAPLPPAIRMAPATAMLGTLALGVLVAARGAAEFTCNCFGSTSTSKPAAHLAVNVVLMIIGACGMVLGPSTNVSNGFTVLAAGLGLITGVLAMLIISLLDAPAPGLVRAGGHPVRVGG
jgi:hypothetical protein